MSCDCGKKPFILLKGYASRWDGVDWMSISFKSDTKVDFTGFSAKLKIGQYVFENNDLSQDWIVNLTDEQTGTLPLGPNTASLIVYDTIGEGKPFTTNIPILVKDWVDGDITVDTYKATILATLDNKNEFIVNVETAKVSLQYVDEKISQHNLSEEAHPYIQLILSQKQDKLTSENAGENITIEDVDGHVVISSKAGSDIFNLDGGKANSVYTVEQNINGGNAEWLP